MTALVWRDDPDAMLVSTQAASNWISKQGRQARGEGGKEGGREGVREGGKMGGKDGKRRGVNQRKEGDRHGHV